MSRIAVDPRKGGAALGQPLPDPQLSCRTLGSSSSLQALKTWTGPFFSPDLRASPSTKGEKTVEELSIHISPV